MRKYKLSNGLTIIENNRKTDSVTIQVIVNVGSNHEKEGIRGISHFIEHMLFEGTKNRKNAKEISNEIESLGGEINAYTNNVRTCFYIKVPKKHFEKAADILSDIIINPLFGEKEIEKERKVILKEINIFNDESRYFQWILFSQSLFTNHPSRFPAYGTKKDVNNIKRKQIVDFFKKNYVASNSIVSVVGDIRNSDRIITKYFGSMKKGNKISAKCNKDKNKPRKIVKKRKILNSYMVLGFQTVPRHHKDAYVLDVIQSILGRGQSGRIFDEIRNKRGLAYEVGVLHEASTDFGYFAVYLSTDKKNIPLIKKLILKEFQNLRNITEKELKEAIGFVEGKYLLDNEDTHNMADTLGFWELVGDVMLSNRYLDKVKKVKANDINNVVNKYFNNNYALAVIEQN
jgi:predicted Zn-dependent peptidase